MQVLTRAALVVAKQVERQQAAEKSTRTQILGSKGGGRDQWDRAQKSLERECGPNAEWSEECQVLSLLALLVQKCKY
jgi:hypothetical protein